MRLLLLALFLSCSLTAAAAQSHPVVVIETSAGVIEVELDSDKAPKTVANFLSYVDDKFYDQTVFHRVINGFMIQGGGFGADLKQKKTKPAIVNEAGNGLKNTNGTIAMARMSDPNSASAEFFINVKDNAFLDHKSDNPREFGYCVFGKVVKGMEVVDQIKAVKTGMKEGVIEGEKVDLSDVPVETVVIKSVKRKGKEK
jgi:peptidyl-prolyl cis-trans isomerase B (cyclophilin B)